MLRMVSVILVGMLVLTACGGSNDTQAIIAATQAYVAETSDIANVTVDVEAVDGDFARAHVTPPDTNATDPAWVFLKRENGTWHGLTIGTAFAPDDYQQLGIPQDLWLK